MKPDGAVGMRVGQVWRDALRDKAWKVLRVGNKKAQLRAEETAFVVTANVWIDRVLDSEDWVLVADV